MFRYLLSVLAITVATTALRAEDDTPLRKLLTADASRGWEGVGRLDIANRTFCTGALISPELVLTAAHCLFDPEDSSPIPPEDILFRAGFRLGRAAAERPATEAIPHPKFDPQEAQDSVRVAYDVALIRLSQPIRNISIKPFRTGLHPAKGDEVGVVSYGESRTESPSLQEVCRVMARQSGALILSCDAQQGSSGAPVFILDSDGHPTIVSVISALAQSKGGPVTLGANLQDTFGELMESSEGLLSETDHGNAPRVFSLTGRGQGGAKFVRP